mmetsp:Transcript_21796/g.43741  ORF Transcript_21796/g.43741 Transcript_21796/m.43741 type:complete len:479 (-) Transcript_21796:317-1753(-)
MMRFQRNDVKSEASQKETPAGNIFLKKLCTNQKNTSLPHFAHIRWHVQIFIFVVLAFLISMLQWTHSFNRMELSSPKEHILKSSHRVPPLQDSSFSACLLIKDDNDKLSEWLAYHYTAASLKNLIVAEDPKATTSALPILELWNRTTDMEIFLWKDANYMPEGDKLKEKLNKISTTTVRSFKFSDQASREMIKLHMVRQKEFISKCLLFHQQKDRKWTMLIDTDEYLVFNKKDSHGNERGYEKSNMQDKRKGDMLREVQTLRKVLPKVGSESIAEYAEKHKLELPWDIEPCMSLPRLFFGSVESSESALKKDVPTMFDAKKFDTLRYRHHAKKGAFEHNSYDKSIIDVSRIATTTLEKILDPHRLVGACSKSRTRDYMEEPSPRVRVPKGLKRKQRKKIRKVPLPPRFSRIDQTLLRVHHYLGSWEAYNSRKDIRRTRKKFEEKGNVDFGSDDDIRPWLNTFIDLVGEEKAQNLLINE